METIHSVLAWAAFAFTVTAIIARLPLLWKALHLLMPAFTIHLAAFNVIPRALWALHAYSLWAVFIPSASLWRLVVVGEAIWWMDAELDPEEDRYRRHFALSIALANVCVLLITFAVYRVEHISIIPEWIYEARTISEVFSVGALTGAAMLSWNMPIRKVVSGARFHLWVLCAYFGSMAFGDSLQMLDRHEDFLKWDSLTLAIQCGALALWTLHRSGLEDR